MEPAIANSEGGSVPACFVVQLAAYFAGRRVENEPVKAALCSHITAGIRDRPFGRPGHAGDVKVLNSDGHPPCREAFGESLESCCAAFRYLVVYATETLRGAPPSTRALLRARQSMRGFNQMAVICMEVPRIFDRLSSGERRQVVNAGVDTDGFCRYPMTS